MLRTSFAGLTLESPLIVSSGPATWSGEAMSTCMRRGAGAVVTKTIVEHPKPNPRPRIVIRGDGMQNIELYTEHTVQQWRQEIAIAKGRGAIVIASIMGYSIEEVVRLADKVQEYGADALELGISCPHGNSGRTVGADPDLTIAYTRALVSHASVPVIVKLSPNVTDISQVAKAVEAGGANAISAIDTVRCLIGVDIEFGKPFLPTYGGYSGPAIKPIALACVASIASCVDIPVSGIGGIMKASDALEHMMLGASTFQLCTGIIWGGFDLISEINRDLEVWLEKHGYSSLDEVVGKALPYLVPFEKVQLHNMVASVNDEMCNGCKKCLSCVYNAVGFRDGKAIVNAEVCTGCGVCVYLCPVQAIVMKVA
jgi:dihydropyrimidine dehydrogenase (NAD+) subunit PreA